MQSLVDDIKQDVKSNCATYAGGGRCLLDRPCPFLSKDVKDGARCSYYENAVLPADDTLTLRYWSRFSKEATDKGSVKVCQSCNKVFTPKSNAEKYCGGCRDERSEEHTSELQSRFDLVCRLLLEKKKTTRKRPAIG